jgi:hypothetical protein
MRVHRAQLRRRQIRRRRAAALAALAVLLAGAWLAVAQPWSGTRSTAAQPPATPGSSQGPGQTDRSSPPPVPPATDRPTDTLSISAVGDTMLGTGSVLAPNPGSYFSGVSPALAAQVVFANLEGTLTDHIAGKCGAGSTACFEFRVPPSWARYLKQAGFTFLNNANNHSFDFGQAGLDDTVAALDRAGLRHTGRTHEITYLREGDLTVGFIGVGPYSNNGPLNDYPAARALIRQADRRADIVVVAMHAGAEGTGALHLTGRDEVYFGENRGNPEAFAHMAVDAGADLILGSGPHVLRGMELYRRRLIAYSLGNFAGYHNFTLDGALGVSAILHVKLAPDGAFLSGRIVSVRLVGAGQPELDPSGAGAALIGQLSREDLGQRGVRIGAGGAILAR